MTREQGYLRENSVMNSLINFELVERFKKGVM
jgi:hypothetical protein